MTEIELRPFTADDRAWMIAVHRDTYERDEGFDRSFSRLIAQILDDFIATHDPAYEQGWIAWRGDARVGSIFCVRLDSQIAKLRLFQVLPQERGTGLGRNLLQTCTAFARDKGYIGMRLWTHKSHEAACALYLRNGWSIVSERAVTSFGQSLIEQEMALSFEADHPD